MAFDYSFGYGNLVTDAQRLFASFDPPTGDDPRVAQLRQQDNTKTATAKRVTITFTGISPDLKLVVDAVTDEGHNLENAVTKHPVEEGADITDNIRPKPRKLMLTGVITSAPLDWQGRVVPDAAKSSPPDPTTLPSAYGLLKSAWQLGALLTVDTRLAGEPPYQNMAIASLKLPKTAGKGRDLWFGLELEEVLFVTAKTARVPASAYQSPKVAHQAAPRRYRGHKTTPPLTATQQAAKDRVAAAARGKTSANGMSSWLAAVLGQH